MSDRKKYTFFNRSFEGYVENLVVDKNGKSRIERTYVGPYYRQELNFTKYVVLRFLYFFLFLISGAAFFCGNTMIDVGKTVIYLALPQALAFLGYVCIFVALILYVTAKRDMTIGVYRETSHTLKLFSALTAICCVLACVAGVVFLCALSDVLLSQILGLGLQVLGGLLVFLIYIIERSVRYSVKENPNKDCRGVPMQKY